MLRTEPKPTERAGAPAAARRLGRRLGLALTLAALVALALVPATGNDYWMRTLTFIFMFAIMAEGWNIIGGFTGYAAFGQVAWFGMGAYAVAVAMTKWDWPFGLALLLAAVLPAVVAGVIGVAVLRLRGHYFAIATLALGIAVGQLANNIGYVGASSGMSLPIGPSFTFFYYAMLAALVAAVLVVWAISRSRFGYALLAIRENEQAALTLGVNAAYYKTAAFAVSALLTGIAGGIYAYWTSFIDAPTVFNITFNVDMIVMAILGGAATVVWPVVGAFILEGLNETLSSSFLHWHAVIFGALVVLIVLFLPGGIAGLVGRQRFDLRSFVRELRAYRV